MLLLWALRSSHSAGTLPTLKKTDGSVWETAFQNKAWLFGSSVGARADDWNRGSHSQTSSRDGGRPVGSEGGSSYQDDGADWVGGQDVILQGSAVTLGLDVGGTLVMELGEAEEGINQKLEARSAPDLRRRSFLVSFASHVLLLLLYFLSFRGCKQVFSECKLVQWLVRYERCKKQTLNNKKQWEYNEEKAASPREASYRDLTPHTVEPSQALVTLNGFVTLVTLGGAVPLHPEMMHDLWREGEASRWEGTRGRRKRKAQKQDKRHESHNNNS